MVEASSIFAREAYLKSLSEEYGWFTDTNFILPFIITTKESHRLLTFSSNTVYRTDHHTIHHEKEFLNKVVHTSKKLNIDQITQPKTSCVFRTYPEDAVVIPWGCYQKDLRETEDNIFAQFHSHHRRVIRKAIRDGITIENGHHLLNDCHDLIKQTMKRQHLPYVGLEQLAKYAKEIPDNVSFYISRDDEKPHSCAIIVFDGLKSNYIHGGSITNPHHGASALLHWSAMKDMKQRGIKIYDFIGGRVNPAKGSKQETIQIFKSRFGTVFHKGYFWKFDYYQDNCSTKIRSVRPIKPYMGDIIDNEINSRNLEKSEKINHL